MTSGAWTLRRGAFGLVPNLHAADAKQRALARCLVPSSAALVSGGSSRSLGVMRTRMLSILLSVLIGVAVTAPLTVAASVCFDPGAEVATRILSWPNTLLQVLCRRSISEPPRGRSMSVRRSTRLRTLPAFL